MNGVNLLALRAEAMDLARSTNGHTLWLAVAVAHLAEALARLEPRDQAR